MRSHPASPLRRARARAVIASAVVLLTGFAGLAGRTSEAAPRPPGASGARQGGLPAQRGTNQAAAEPVKNNLCFDDLTANTPDEDNVAFRKPTVTTNASGYFRITWTTTAPVGGGFAYPIEMRVRTRTYDAQSQTPCATKGVSNFNDGLAYSDPLGLAAYPNHTYAVDQVGDRVFTFKDLTDGSQGGTVSIPESANTGGGAGFTIEQLFTLNGSHSAVYYFPFQSSTPANAPGWTQKFPAASPKERSFHSMAYDAARGQVVLFGGMSPNRDLRSDTWIWDGSDWAQRPTAGGPSSRYSSALAYDTAHGQIVLFGGTNDATFFGDTWVWDGSAWTQKFPATSPPGRSDHFMAYDAARGQVVLFGGFDGTTFLNETWVWDGSNWAQKSPANSPPGRAGGQFMTYDSARNQVVLVGGYISLDDTWVWDGSTWQEKLPATRPPKRWYGAVAYEAARDQVVFFGGYLAPGSHDDTWVWDGSTWAQRLPPASPPARQGHAMAYDPVRAQVVLFGGGANGGPTSGDTWVWSSAGLAPPARPLIFIPGLMGSSLDSDSLIRSNLWPGVVSDHNSLTLDPAKQQTNLIPVEAIGHVTSVVIYDPLLNFLRTTGGYREYLVNGDPARRTTAGCDLGQSSNHPDLFVFAYDWRLSNSENVAKLKDYVGCVQRFYPGTKVDLLTHSMGGLIARRYIITNPADHAVEKLVTIAAPWLGAPKAINVMETGEYDNLNKLIFKSTLRSLAEYFPSAHQLLPSPQYFALGGRPYVKDGTLFRDYDQFATAFNSEFPRSLPATDGKTFHDRPGQDDWRADQSGVTYYHIYGQRPVADTISAVTNTTVTSRGLFGSKTYHVFNTTFTRGDKTVPVLSAERRNAGAGIDLNAPGATLKLFDGPISLGADYYEHTGLTRNPNVLNYIRSILKPSPPAAPPWAESGAPAAASAAAPAYYVRVVGAGSVLVADAASHTTDPLADLSDDGVPDVTTYRAGEKSALVVAPADQAVSITARSDGDPMSVEISKGSDVDTSEAVRYQDLSLPAGVKLQLKFGPSGLESLKYDADGDGTFESTVAPTASASGAAAQDTEPPQLAASQTPHGSSAILTLSATDVGSGVKAIYYSTDGSNFLPYTGALTFAAPGKRVVYAFADDNVANRSQLLTVKVPFPPPKRWGVISPRTKGN